MISQLHMFLAKGGNNVISPSKSRTKYLIDAKLGFWCHSQHLRALMPACRCNASNCGTMRTVVAVALQGTCAIASVRGSQWTECAMSTMCAMWVDCAMCNIQVVSHSSSFGATAALQAGMCAVSNATERQRSVLCRRTCRTAAELVLPRILTHTFYHLTQV
jgi:hypothetical protein